MIKADYIVIAKSGLFLREMPGTESEKLTKIPYFSKVKVLDDVSYKLDTTRVNRYKSRPDLEWEFTNSWVKVKYKNFEGYVLGLYIAPDYEKKTPILRDEYTFACSKTTCDFNYHPNPNLQWTGIYKDGSTKSVSFDYKFQHGNNMSPMINYVDKADDLLFCVGGNFELDNKVIEATTNFGLGFSELKDELKWLAQKGITAKPIKSKNGDDGFQYTLNIGTQKQLLNTKELGVEVGYIHAFLWIGDLDSDGIEDYVIRYSGYPDRIVLYLSSEAEEGEIVAPVAIYFSGKCC